MTIPLLRRTARRLGRYIAPQGSPAPGGEKGAGWYDDHYAAAGDEPVQPYARSRYYFLWTVIADRIRRAGIRRVLEIGCGPGQLAAFLLDQGVEQYVGLDFSPKAVDMARRQAPAARFVVGDARTTDLHAEAEHDAVVCTEVLEHIPEDLLVVSRFRPGKRCLCSVPNFPFDSHVRHFRDAAEVAARYGPFFRELDVATFPSPSWSEDRFFLLDGIRNEHTQSL